MMMVVNGINYNIKQEYSSAKTSVRKIPAVYTNYEFQDGNVILDYGCGKFVEDVQKRLYNTGCIVLPYDPYNQPKDVNDTTMELAKTLNIDYIVCSCVLNVIKETEIIKDIINDIRTYSNPNTKIIFNIYQGNKSSVCNETSCGWQRNEPTRNYAELISEFLKITKVKGNFIEACLYSKEERMVG